MEKREVIKNIGKRAGGDIYLGVVGAVRTGKSTFIKKFMENIIIPNRVDDFEKKRSGLSFISTQINKTTVGNNNLNSILSEKWFIHR